MQLLRAELKLARGDLDGAGESAESLARRERVALTTLDGVSRK